MYRLREYYYLVRLDRPIGILLLLWPTLWGLWIASAGEPKLLVLTVFVAGVVLMRSAGCAINDFADRHVDPYVERTQQRPLAAGRISEKEALMVFVVLSLVAFVLVLLLNWLTILMSFVAAALAASYPFMKRYTHMPQFYLGAAFGWSIPMAFAAQTGGVPDIAWALFMANVFWAVAYDTAYAMVDRDDDIKIGVRSTAILFGRYDRFMIGLNHLLCLLLLIWTGFNLQLSVYYYAGLLVAAIIAGYEQWLMRDRKPGSCFKAFLNNHYFGMVIFMGMAVHYLVY
ncbi:MAG: 4-hydroxybenzoate octaprenyltransferase [Proteobacteria bacterium]|nr:4-hydroxybenzoate octaprenyltransferase [Pseudomonadota bacterium]